MTVEMTQEWTGHQFLLQTPGIPWFQSGLHIVGYRFLFVAGDQVLPQDDADTTILNRNAVSSTMVNTCSMIPFYNLAQFSLFCSFNTAAS